MFINTRRRAKAVHAEHTHSSHERLRSDAMRWNSSSFHFNYWNIFCAGLEIGLVFSRIHGCARWVRLALDSFQFFFSLSSSAFFMAHSSLSLPPLLWHHTHLSLLFIRKIKYFGKAHQSVDLPYATTWGRNCTIHTAQIPQRRFSRFSRTSSILLFSFCRIFSRRSLHMYPYPTTTNHPNSGGWSDKTPYSIVRVFCKLLPFASFRFCLYTLRPPSWVGLRFFRLASCRCHCHHAFIWPAYIFHAYINSFWPHNHIDRSTLNMPANQPASQQ